MKIIVRIAVILILIVYAAISRANIQTPSCLNWNPFPYTSCPNPNGGPSPDPGGPPPDGGMNPNPTGLGNSDGGNNPTFNGRGVGDPLGLVREYHYQVIYDFSIPVKHGLSLEITRLWSSFDTDPQNIAGLTSLGYDNASNWFLRLYESRLEPISDSVVYRRSPDGTFEHFAYSGTTNNTHSDLHQPYDASWGTQWASLYYPVGDSRNASNTTNPRPTSSDLELYIIHDHQPVDADDRVDPANILGYVIRDATGTAWYHDADGRLRFYDQNWRNNVQYNALYNNGHVDDYIEVTWVNAYTYKDSTTPTKAIEKVKAPPSDGRYLKFNHPIDYSYSPNRLLAHTASIDLVIGATTYAPLIVYGYQSSGLAQGKLKRVYCGGSYWAQNAYVEYDYGDILLDGSGNVSLDGNGEIQTNQSAAPSYDYLSVISKYLPAVSRNVGIVATRRTAEFMTEQYIRDPQSSVWRKAIGKSRNHHFTSGDPRIYYLSGENIANSSDKYDSFGTYATYSVTWAHDVDVSSYNSISNAPTRIDNVMISSSRLVDKKQATINGTLTTLEDYSYVDATNGLSKLSSKTVYSTSDPASAMTTTYSYSDSDNPSAPSSIIHPDGRKYIYNYNAEGKVETYTHQQLNTSTSSYITIETVDYIYVTSGVNTGLLASVTVTPAAGPTHTTTYTYGATIGTRAGELLSVTYDGQTSTYSYNDFGQVLTQQTVDGTITNTYSTAVGVTHFLPARLVSSTAGGVQTTYAYDTEYNVSSKTVDSQSTTFTYNKHNLLSSMTAPGAGTISYTYNIYGKLTALYEPSGHSTIYSYDAFGRVYQEDVWSSGAVLDTRNTYAYTGSGTSGCGCGGAKSNNIASRTIAKGLSSETVSFSYDLLGRITLSDSSVGEITYSYTGTHLTEIDHDTSLWGTQKLKYEYDDLGRLKREVYPNDRSIDFTYDAAGRMLTIKDPFGFINKAAYDDANEGKLQSLTHSSLGTLEYAYDADERLETMTLGNGAYTEYSYDSYGRVNDILHRDGKVVHDQLSRMTWSYDALGRKDATADITMNTLNYPSNSKLDIAYDSGNRLSADAFKHNSSTIWSTGYTYDTSGNRTNLSASGGGIANAPYVMTYGVSNRETNATNIVPNTRTLSYDFKGNVTSRPPLGGGNTYTYTWDALDRMTSAASTGQTTVYYTYDVAGRLLRRDKGSETKVSYWLGVDRIAEEVWGSDSGNADVIFRPDSETGTNPQTSDVNGWKPDSGTVSYETNEASRGKVVKLNHTSDAFFRNGDVGNADLNANDVAYAQTGRNQLGLWMRNANTNKPIRIGVHINTSLGHKTLTFITQNCTDFKSVDNLTMYDYIGMENGAAGYNDNQWHYMEFDLEARIQPFFPGATITSVNGLGITAKELYLDDIIISEGKMRRVYQLTGGGLNGTVSEQRAPANSNDKWYYHYNELGTVIAATGANGYPIATWIPDFYGNYRVTTYTTVGAVRPEIGLTGKIWDQDAGLYNFYARWCDPERGIFISTDPLGYTETLSLYSFARNNPTIYTDPLGLRSMFYGAGRLCMGKNCKSKLCEGRSKGEDSGPTDPLESLPAPGKCVDSDGLYTRKGILKIPDNCECTILCDKSGAPTSVSCKCSWAPGSPAPSVTPPGGNPPPGFPPNPYG